MTKQKNTPNDLSLFPMDKIEIRNSPIHRYGVFAKKSIQPKEIIEEGPVITIKNHTIRSSKTLVDRAFYWSEDESAIPSGYGLIYNHGETPNAEFQRDHKKKTLKFVANKAIPAGAEILVDYGLDWIISREEKYPDMAKKAQEKKSNKGILKIMIIFVILFLLSIIFPTEFSINGKSKQLKTNNTSKTK